MRPLSFLFISMVLLGCGKSKVTPEPVLVPTKTVLLFPVQDEACLTGQAVNDKENLVDFKWDRSEHADGYVLKIRNLLTHENTSHTLTATTLTVKLKLNTPYSWSVVSQNSGKGLSAESNTWKFYNAGAGAVSYPPYPAELLSPGLNTTMEATTAKVTLRWSGKDIDNDISAYSLYFGDTSSPDILASEIKETFREVTVNTAKKYYWKVRSVDVAGNTSDSQVFVFNVK